MIWARDVEDDSVKGFVVEKGTAGFTATKMEGKLALRTVQNADLVLDGVRVPEANRLATPTGSRTPTPCCATPAAASPGARSAR